MLLKKLLGREEEKDQSGKFPENRENPEKHGKVTIKHKKEEKGRTLPSKLSQY